MTPHWLGAFIDLPPDALAPGVAFWATVTGYDAGRVSDADVEFPPLVPPEGDPYLFVQRLGSGQPRVHVDLFVTDVDGAVDDALSAGADLVDRREHAVLTSPGGFPLCLVAATGAVRPPPRTWPGGHTSYVDQVCLDIPPSRYDAELDFWEAVTGWARRDPRPGSEFGRLTPGPDQPLQLLLQRLDDEQEAVSAHLDWSSSDHEAEVDRHVAAGAEVEGRFEGWTVLRDPVGLTYCVTRRQTGDRPE